MVPYRHYELGHAQGFCQLCVLSRLPPTLKPSLKLSLQQVVQRRLRPMGLIRTKLAHK